MFKKNKIVPLSKPVEQYKFKELKRVDECDNIHNFFKTQVKVEAGERSYTTTFYVKPRENKCCAIL
jgi:hypothetical protein